MEISTQSQRFVIQNGNANSAIVKPTSLYTPVPETGGPVTVDPKISDRFEFSEDARQLLRKHRREERREHRQDIRQLRHEHRQELRELRREHLEKVHEVHVKFQDKLQEFFKEKD